MQLTLGDRVNLVTFRMLHSLRWMDRYSKETIDKLFGLKCRRCGFKRSIDTFENQKIGEFIAEALLEIIDEVGVENVV